MRQHLVQIADIERLRVLKLERAERDLALLQQQIAQAADSLADALKAESDLKNELATYRGNLFKSDTASFSGQGLKSRVAEMLFLEQQLAARHQTVLGLRQQVSSLHQRREQAEQHFRRCNTQLQGIQLQRRQLQKQFRKAQARRAETDVEELFVQRISSKHAERGC